MAIYYPLYPGEDEWSRHCICKVCQCKAKADEAMMVLVFDARHKYYICRHCLERFLAKVIGNAEENLYT